MDPYSLSVEKEASKNIEENERECFKDAIVSSRSLNTGFKEPPKLKTAMPQVAASAIAASYHITVGLTMAYSAVLIPQLEKETRSINNTANGTDADNYIFVTQAQTSWMASIVVLATPIGALIAGFLMETVGRLKTIQIAAVPNTIGWILIATATNVPMILIGRLLTGLASALGTSPAIVYITEVSRPELRGSLVSTGPTMASFGMLMIYVKGACFGWRQVSWICIAWAAVPTILIQIFSPESPVWLASKDRLADAKKSLEWLHKLEPKQGKLSAAESQYNTILKEREIKLNEQRRSNHGDKGAKLRAFLKPTGWKPMSILFLFFLFQQFSGIYITLFYAVTWFEQAGSTMNPYTASILVGLTRMMCSMVNTWLLRRYKRRLLCMVSSLGMAICMGVSGYFTWTITSGQTAGSLVPVICLLLYVCTSMVGMLTIPWTMTAELFPTEIRGIAHSISYSLANILMFAAVQSYVDLSAAMGGSHGLQWFFAGVSVGAAVFIYIMLPETHGKKLSEIEEYFHNHYVAIGAEVKTKKRMAKKRAVQKSTKTPAAEPLNPKLNQTV